MIDTGSDIALEVGMLAGTPTARMLIGGHPVATLTGTTEDDARRKALQWLSHRHQDPSTHATRPSSALSPGAPIAPQTLLARTAEALANRMPPNMRLGNPRPHYQKVYRTGWPSTVHYEVLVRVQEGMVGVELHVEDERQAAALARTQTLEGTVRDALPEAEVVFRTAWQKVGTRLAALVPLGAADPHALAWAMGRLIAVTRPAMDKALGVASDDL